MCTCVCVCGAYSVCDSYVGIHDYICLFVCLCAYSVCAYSMCAYSVCVCVYMSVYVSVVHIVYVHAWVDVHACMHLCVYAYSVCECVCVYLFFLWLPRDVRMIIVFVCVC